MLASRPHHKYFRKQFRDFHFKTPFCLRASRALYIYFQIAFTITTKCIPEIYTTPRQQVWLYFKRSCCFIHYLLKSLLPGFFYFSFFPMPTRNVANFVSNSATKMVAQAYILQEFSTEMLIPFPSLFPRLFLKCFN